MPNFQSIRGCRIQGFHKFDGKLGPVGNDSMRQDCVETEIYTDAKRGERSSGTSGYSKMFALHHVQTAKQYLGTLPRA